MSIDPEFDPFLERMPAGLRFYMDAQSILEQKMAEVAEVAGVDLDLNGERWVFFEEDGTPIPASCLGADSVRLNDMVDMTTQTPAEPLFKIEMATFNDGSPYMRDEDLDFMDSKGIPAKSKFAWEAFRNVYQVYATPESTPFAVPERVIWWVSKLVTHGNDALERRRRLNPTYQLELISKLPSLGYNPQPLSDQDCQELITALRQARVSPKDD